MTTLAPPQPKHFATQRRDDPDCINGQTIRDTYWALFGMYAVPGHDVSDFDTTVAVLRSATGFKKGWIKRAILAHARLQDLPRLRSLQAETRVLDMEHLFTINKEMEELGPEVDPEVLELFDDMLVNTFTPKRNNQELPETGLITRRIRDLIRKYDPSRAYSPKKRKQREKAVNTLAIDQFTEDGIERGIVQLAVDGATAEQIHTTLVQTARERKSSMFESALALLTGEAQASPNVVLHLYAPKDRVPGDSVYIPGYGWTNPEDTATIEQWLAHGTVKEVDLDAAAEREVGGYVPTPDMKAYAVARDGTCIFPGCNRRADTCQLDHRIPYNEGGATTPENLFSLCQHHHNQKTDRRATYIPDPVTGDIVWLFDDGTYTIVEPEGILHEQITPTSPRWCSSLASVRAIRAVTAEFLAKCHTVADQFDRDLNLEAAKEKIAALEEEYGRTFPFELNHPPKTRQEEGPPPVMEEPVEHPDDPPPGPNPFHDATVPQIISIEEKIRQMGSPNLREAIEALQREGYPFIIEPA